MYKRQDLDGVIDLDDKCVTTPGLVQNHGCPYITEDTMEIIEEINKFEGIEFELNKDVIRPQSFAKLDRAAAVSYTHLDVYKRQLLYSSPLKISPAAYKTAI